MFIDITLKITPEMSADAKKITSKELVGHLGTHFDAMDKEFPLEYTKRKGVIFDVSGVEGRDIDLCDIDITRVKENTFVAFYTGYIEKVPYGSKTYFSEHPQLSYELISTLLEKKISIIGIDFGGIRRTPEHIPADQLCADKSTFVVENLCNLKSLLNHTFTAHTYPMNFTHLTGLPCRVIAEI